MASALNGNSGGLASATSNSPLGVNSAGLDLLQFIQDNRSTIANYTAPADGSDRDGGLTGPLDPTTFDYGKLIMYALESKLSLTDQQLANVRNGVRDLPGDAGKVQPAAVNGGSEHEGGTKPSTSDWFDEDDPATPFTDAQVISNLVPFVGTYVISPNSPRYAKSSFIITADTVTCKFYLYDPETDSIAPKPVEAAFTGAGNSQDKTTFRITKFDASALDAYLELQFTQAQDVPEGTPAVTFKTPAAATAAVPKVAGHQVPPTRNVALGYWIGLYKFESSNLAGYGFAVSGTDIRYGSLTDKSKPQDWSVVKYRVAGSRIEWDVSDRGTIGGAFGRETNKNGQIDNPSFHGTLKSADKEEEVTATFVEYSDKSILESPGFQWWSFLATVGAIPGLIAVVVFIAKRGIKLRQMQESKARIQAQLLADKATSNNSLDKALLSTVNEDPEQKQKIVDHVTILLDTSVEELAKTFGEGAKTQTIDTLDSFGREQISKHLEMGSTKIYDSLVQRFDTDKKKPVSNNKDFYNSYVKISLQDSLSIKCEALKSGYAKANMWRELVNKAERDRADRDRAALQPGLDVNHGGNPDGAQGGQGGGSGADSHGNQEGAGGGAQDDGNRNKAGGDEAKDGNEDNKNDQSRDDKGQEGGEPKPHGK